jgi:hypothetical protein
LLYLYTESVQSQFATVAAVSTAVRRSVSTAVRQSAQRTKTTTQIEILSIFKNGQFKIFESKPTNKICSQEKSGADILEACPPFGFRSDIGKTEAMSHFRVTTVAVARQQCALCHCQQFNDTDCCTKIS